jgi:DNA-nicking Smr family endonuclease
VKLKPDEQEVALFREATRGVKPLAHAVRVTGDRPKPRPRAHFSRAVPAVVLDEIPSAASGEPEPAAGDATLFVRPGVPQTLVCKLRRGQLRVQAELDLHGLTAAEAQRRLHAFLVAAVQRSAGCLRIVHGKGLRSGPRGPVLRLLVSDALRRTSQVLAFASARPVDGGTGAVYVLLATPHASSASTSAD